MSANSFWLGASVHDAKGAAEAAGEGADYAFLGTIFATPSHPGRAGMGLEGLAAVAGKAKAIPRPFHLIAIGGIDAARAAEVLGAGAYGIAAVRGIWGSRDPAAAVEHYRAAIASTLAATT
jgi:thiamine-phosphate diphosphorylase